MAKINGRRVVVRPAVPDDAAGMLDCVRQVAEEGIYFLTEPSDLRTVEQQRVKLACLDPEMEAIIVAEVDGVIAGSVHVARERKTKVRHTAALGIGLAPAYRGMGLGKSLMAAAEDWARRVGVRKLFLGVFAINERARRLYEHLGYEVEGVQKRQVLINGEYVDDVLMGKWLG